MDEIGKNDIYKAECILDTKNVKGKRYFLIKWDGWNESNNTWEPEKNIIDTKLIDIFYELRKNPTNNKEITSKNAALSTKKISDNETVKHSGEKDKFQNDLAQNSRKEIELRSVIRIAGGLRPLSISKSYQSSLNKYSQNYKQKGQNNLLLSDTNSSSESNLSDEKNEPIKQHMKTRTVNLSSSKSTNRFMRRRKLSSSSFDSSVSGSSSVLSLKRRIKRNNKNQKSENKDLEIEGQLSTNKNTHKIFHNKKITNMNLDELSANESDDFSYDDYNLVNSANEDVFITDITSGFVTVTIKESFSPAGFFKNRDNP